MMNVEQLVAFLDARYRAPGDRLFRLEALPQYLVDSDGEDFRRWLAGAAEPTWSRKQPWLDVLADDRRRGLLSSRVRILSEQLTDYERYACEWGYALNSRFEDIRVLHRGEHDIPDMIIKDFWLIGDDQVVLMHYDRQGRYEAAEALDVDRAEAYVATRDVGLSVAEPFAQWWARHPELYRTTQSA